MGDHINGDGDADEVAVFHKMLFNENQNAGAEQNRVWMTNWKNWKFLQSRLILKKTARTSKRPVLIRSATNCHHIQLAEAYFSKAEDGKSLTTGKAHERERFGFGNKEHTCEGALTTHMVVVDDIVIKSDAFAVPIDVPLLLGLDVLRK